MHNDVGELYKHIYYSNGEYHYHPIHEGKQEHMASGTLPKMLYEKDCYEKCDGDLDLFCNISLDYTYIEELLPPFPYERDQRYGDLKYIQKTRSGNYIIWKYVDEKNGYFGRYKTLKEAKKMRDALMAADWDKTILPPSPEPKNYTYNKKENVFRVYKWLDGRNVFFGKYKSENTAQKVVEKLKQCGWDKTQLKKIQEEVL